jgi:uncharacterized protein YbjT (DUF2867 family)
MSRILVLGGTGKVGRRLSARIAADGHTPVVATRSTTPHFDWHTPSTYDGALEGVDGVFVVGPGSATDWSDLLSDLLTRAATAGVRNAVLLSARGVEFLPDGVVARTEQAFRAGPLPGTILRPTHFAQNFTEAMFVPRDGKILAPVGDAVHPFIDTGDIADVAAMILLRGGHEGEVIELSGPAALGFHEVAETLSKVSGRTVEYVPESRDEHLRRLRDAGPPEGYVVWRMAMLDGIASGRDARVSDGVDQILGRKATTFDQWAHREAAGNS